MKNFLKLLIGTLAILAFEIAQRIGAVQCMAKAKYSALLSDLRGGLNGSVASRNRYGNYLRTKTTPINRQTTYQTTIRNLFGAVSQAFRDLTTAQIKSWNSAVSNFIGTNVFGDSVTPSGSNLHQAINMNLAVIGESLLTEPPIPTAVNYFTTFTAAVAEGAGTMLLTFAPVIDAGDTIIVFGTPAVSPGKSFLKNQYRKFDLLTSADLTGIDVATEYEAKFGTIGAAGQKIGLALKVVNKATGLSGIMLTTEAIIAA